MERRLDDRLDELLDELLDDELRAPAVRPVRSTPKLLALLVTAEYSNPSPLDMSFSGSLIDILAIADCPYPAETRLAAVIPERTNGRNRALYGEKLSTMRWNFVEVELLGERTR